MLSHPHNFAYSPDIRRQLIFSTTPAPSSNLEFKLLTAVPVQRRAAHSGRIPAHLDEISPGRNRSAILYSLEKVACRKTLAHLQYAAHAAHLFSGIRARCLVEHVG